jgi:hypothetical protein
MARGKVRPTERFLVARSVGPLLTGQIFSDSGFTTCHSQRFTACRIGPFLYRTCDESIDPSMGNKITILLSTPAPCTDTSCRPRGSNGIPGPFPPLWITRRTPGFGPSSVTHWPISDCHFRPHYGPFWFGTRDLCCHFCIRFGGCRLSQYGRRSATQTRAQCQREPMPNAAMGPMPQWGLCPLLWPSMHHTIPGFGGWLFKAGGSPLQVSTIFGKSCI